MEESKNMKPFIQGIILGFITGVIFAVIAYAYLLFSYEELDLHDIPIERSKKDESN